MLCGLGCYFVGDAMVGGCGEVGGMVGVMDFRCIGIFGCIGMLGWLMKMLVGMVWF